MEQVYRAKITSPLGTLVGLATDIGLCQLEFEPTTDAAFRLRSITAESKFSDLNNIEKNYDNILKAHSVFTVIEGHPIFEEVQKQLDAYFSGEKFQFTIPLHFVGTPFQIRVWEQLGFINFGRTISYKKLALQLNDAGASRAVGKANGQNTIAIIVPCHRVIGDKGDLTGYAWGLDRKKKLLQHEGIIPLDLGF